MLALEAIGDVQVPLLAVLPNKMEELIGSTVTRRFQDIRYVEVDKQYFDMITLDNRDDMGRHIRIQNCKVFVKLHFYP